MLALLELQELDRKIAACKAEERELPKQKDKYAIHRKRLAAELKESEDRCKQIQVKQRECAGEIDQRQAQLQKYDAQLYSIRKNEEYKALLHEMELMKKQIAIKEERIIALMLEYDEAKAALEADKERYEKMLLPEQYILATMAQSVYIQESVKLAEAVEKNYKNRMSVRSRGIKQANWIVLIGASMPAILTEVGFISNWNELGKLKKDSYRQEVAQSLFMTIMDFKKEYEKEIVDG